MNKSKLSLLCAAATLAVLSSFSSAAILQTWAGPTTVSGGGTGVLLVNTTSDTGDWINGNGDYTTGSATAPLYFMFTLIVTNNAGETGVGGFFTAIQLSVGLPNNVTAERLGIGNNSTSLSWSGFQSGAGDFVLNGNAVVGGANIISPPETVSFVLKLDQTTSAATIWFNPNLSLAEAIQDPGLTTSLTGLGIEDTFDGVWLRAGLGLGTTIFSDMSVRNDTPFAVVPEPSAALCLGLGALALTTRRRRA